MENTNSEKQNTSQSYMEQLKESFRRFLKEGGATPREENGGFGFSYGDEESSKFIAVGFPEEGNLVQLWLFAFYEISMWDIEKVTKAQNVLNDLNSFGGPRIVYDMEDDDNIVFHVANAFPLSPDFPNFSAYIIAMIRSMMEHAGHFLEVMGEELEGVYLQEIDDGDCDDADTDDADSDAGAAGKGNDHPDEKEEEEGGAR